MPSPTGAPRAYISRSSACVGSCTVPTCSSRGCDDDASAGPGDRWNRTGDDVDGAISDDGWTPEIDADVAAAAAAALVTDV